MADGKDSGPSLVGNGFIWLLLAAAGALLFRQEPPLQGSRPTAIETQVHDHQGSLQDVQARLWQDPLDAIKKITTAAGTDAASVRLGHRLIELVPTIFKQRRAVIVVLLPGAPYAEETELRRRIRYAVLAGLNTERFIPDDEEHLGYFIPEANRSVPLPQAIAFEQFSADTAAAVILWVDEDALTMRDRPLASLNRLVSDLRTAGGENVPAQLKILGPAASSTLRTMRDELRDADASGRAGLIGALQFFDYAASVDDSILLDPEKDKGLFEAPEFYRTAASDGALARALIWELKQRGIDAKPEVTWWNRWWWWRHPAAIALISEWDTFYGQSLPEIVSRCIQSTDSCEPPAASTAQNGTDQVIRFSYMRGLDGELPRTSAPAKKSSDSEENGATTTPLGAKEISKPRPIERAEGQSQFDYLRRLVAQIHAKNEQLVSDTGDRIRAIGVLGSDVYDKLLVLQALRADFPDAIFFTTDLDARFWHPNELRSTRNLIVASSFGLRLRDDLQLSIPPFRDTYQTAAFLASRLAIKGPPVGPSDKNGIPRNIVAEWTKTPLLFQIGRTGPLRLPYAPGGRDVSACRDSSVCQPIQPEAPPIYPRLQSWGAFFSATVIVTVLLALPALVARRLRNAFRAQFPKGISPYNAPFIAAAVGAAAILGIGLCVLWDHGLGNLLTEDGRGEPIVMLEGISLWPTIIFRSLIFLLSMALIFRSFRRVDESIRDTADRLLLGPMRERLNRAVTTAAAGDRWGRFVSAFSYQLAPTPSGNSPTMHDRDWPIAEYWSAYLYKGRSSVRAWRVAVYMAGAMVIALVLAGISEPPNIPHRGAVIWCLYWLTSFTSGLAALYLTCLVIDTTLTFCLFVRQLCRGGSVWPNETLALFEGRLRLEPAQLIDWINLQFIAQRSQAIVGFIYYPFLIIALIILSRNPVFDNYWLIPTLVVFHAIVLAVLVGCVLWLQRTAEAARALALRNLRELFWAEKAAGGGRAAMLELLIAGVENLRDGAFTPISHQPLIRAMLLPLSGFGGSTLLQYFLPGL